MSIINQPTIYNTPTVYNAGGGGGDFSGTIFKTYCTEYENNKDVPILGTCRDFTTLSNNFTAIHELNYYSFKTTSPASESNTIWLGSPMLVYGKKSICKIKTSLSGSKDKSWQILTPVPARVSYFDSGLHTNEKNSIGVALNTTQNYTTNSSYYYNNGNDKHIALSPLELDKIYEVILSFENGLIRIEIENKFVEFNYNYFVNDSPSWMGVLEGGFKLRQNSSGIDALQKLNIHSIETYFE